jgi:hypothetical protein
MPVIVGMAFFFGRGGDLLLRFGSRPALEDVVHGLLQHLPIDDAWVAPGNVPFAIQDHGSWKRRRQSDGLHLVRGGPENQGKGNAVTFDETPHGLHPGAQKYSTTTRPRWV